MSSMSTMEEDIRDVFSLRDRAVKKQNRALFLSTQVGEIEYGSSEEYLAADRMETEIIAIHRESDIEVIAFVKEIYIRDDSDPISAFPVYFLVHTVQGWKIYKAH